MLTLAEQINRRVGRMEALITDLTQVRPNYQPTELEEKRAAELQATLAMVFGRASGSPEEAKL
jgi:hypothetical protein